MYRSSRPICGIRTHGAVLGIALLLLSRAAALPPDTAATKLLMNAKIDEDFPRLEALYKHLHSHPELSFQEEKTAARIAAELKEAGFEV